MSLIDELIAEHCPTGVPIKRLGEVGGFIRGRRFTKDDVVPDGLNSIHYGEIYTHYGTATTTTLSHVRRDLAPRLRFAHTGDVIVAAVGETVEDVCKAVAWLGDDDVAVHDDCFIFRHSMNPKFVSYYFQTGRFHAEKARYVARAKVKRMSADSLAKLTIPTPPPSVQRAIVDVLDRLTELEQRLATELRAELIGRHRQHEAYRESLFTFERERERLDG
jgi:type I restriction enzyme S subunit